LVAQSCKRCVGAHGTKRLDAGGGHRRQDQPQLLLGVAEYLLAPSDRSMRMDDVISLREVGQKNPAADEPLTVRCGSGQLSLDLFVGNDPVLTKIDQKHSAWLQPALLDDLVLRDVQHPGL